MDRGGDVPVEYRLLGPLEAVVDGEPLAVGGRRQRAVLAALLLHRGRPVSAERLVDLVWGEAAPSTAVGTLQAYLSRLRGVLGADAIEREPTGYVMRAASGATDLDRFEDAVRAAEEAAARDRPEDAHEHYAQALSMWRGERFLGEMGAEAFAQAEAARTEELRLAAVVGRVDAALALGRHEDVVGELEAATSRHPYDERLWERLMLAHYRNGRQVEALRTYRHAARLLREEVGVEPGPALQRLEQRILAQDPSLTARVVDVERRAEATNPTNLRSVATSFLGRDRELGSLADRLADSRLVTVTGPGGVGKTRLAVECGWSLIEAMPGGVWDVDLASQDDPSRIGEPLANALDLPFRPGPAALERLAGRIGDRPTLVVLDNCEHLLSAAGELAADLLERCGGLRVLATSREPLGVEGEEVVPLGPLALPADAPGGAADEDAPSVRLFAERAATAVHGFRLTPTNRRAVASVVGRLDGLPLAIELAASTLDLFTPQQLADRLASGFPDLARSGPGEDRHATLRAVIDSSYELLSPAAQHLLERVSVFAGPFDASAATVVGAAPPLTDADVPPALEELARRSLVSPADAGPRGEPRHRLLELVREYAQERLAARGATEAVRERHLEHFLGLATRAAPHLHGPDQVAWYQQLRATHADLELALRTAAAHDGGRLEELVGALWQWWYLDELHGPALTWLARATGGEHPDPELVAAHALVQGEVVEPGATERMLELARRALDLRSGDPAQDAMVELLVGDTMTLDSSHLERAEELLESAAAYFEAHGPVWAEGWARMRLVRVDGYLRADLDAGRERLRWAMALLEQAGDLQLLAYGQLIVGNMARMHGDLADGLDAIREASRLYERLAFRLPLNECRLIEASLLTELGRLEEAERRWHALAEAAERLGSTSLRFATELGAAEVHARRGEHDAARSILESELAIHDDDSEVAARILVALAPLAALTAVGDGDGAAGRAATIASRTLETAGASESPWLRVRGLLAAGEAAVIRDERETAAGLLRQAGELATGIDQPHRVAAALEGLAAALHPSGDDPERVLRLLAAAHQLRDDTGAAPWSYVADRNAEIVRSLRKRLGAEVFATVWHRGAASGVDVLAAEST